MPRVNPHPATPLRDETAPPRSSLPWWKAGGVHGLAARLLTALLLAALTLTADACARDEPPVELAAVLPLSGEWAIYGQPIRNGIELALDEVRGELHGGEPRRESPSRVEVTFADSESDPVRAALLLEELYAGGAVAAVGGVTSAEALAMVPVAEEAGKVLLSPSASSPKLTGISPWFFRIFPSDDREATTLGTFVALELGLTRVVVLSANTTYARGISRLFVAAYERHGREILETLVYPEGTEDLSTPVEQAVALHPQALFVADFAQPVSRILARAKELGFRGKLLTTSAFNAPEVLAATEGVAEDVILTQTAFEPATSDDPAVRRFTAAYRQRFGEAPGTYAAHGYDALHTLVDALERAPLAAGPLSGADPRDPRGVAEGLRSLGTGYAGVTGEIRFDEQGDVGQLPRVYIFQDGAFQDYRRVRETQRRKLLERLEEIRRERREAAPDDRRESGETPA